jgi:branched-chain amino acid transport system permease protein
VGAAVAMVALLATLVVPITQADSRLEPLVLGGVATGLAAALGLLGARRLLSLVAAAALVAVLLAPPLTAAAPLLRSVDLAIVLAIAGLGVVVLGGWGGQPFLAPLAVTGLGAYTTTWVVAGAGQPAVTAVCCALAVTLGLGLVLGAACARRTQAAVAVVTLGLAGALDAAVFRSQWAGGVRLMPAYDPGPASLRHHALVALLGACLLGVVAMRRSVVRLALVAGRSSEAAAAARGVDVAGARRTAWVTACLLAGVAGCALALVEGGAAPALLHPLDSLRLVGLVMVLGRTRIVAALVAGGVCGLAAAPPLTAGALSGGEPTWLDLAVGTSVVVGLIGREMWRRDHKTLRALIGPAAARAVGPVSPSRKPGTWFGAMSGDAE